MRTTLLACLLAASTAHANTPKQLEVNSGTRAKNQYRGPLETITVHYSGETFGSPNAVAAINLSGPNLTPQCVIHFGSLAEALAMAAQIQSDKTTTVSCVDETVNTSTVILQFPLRKPDPKDCPKGNRCSGQFMSIGAKP
jgi:hypothetical protein